MDEPSDPIPATASVAERISERGMPNDEQAQEKSPAERGATGSQWMRFVS